MRTRRHMHGRRRRRSPVKLSAGLIESLFGKKNVTKEQEEGQAVATAKNTMSAQDEASEAVGKVGIDKDKQHDETHTHPPAAFEKENEEGTQDAMIGDANSERAKAQGRLVKMKGKTSSRSGGWGQRTFGF